MLEISTDFKPVHLKLSKDKNFDIRVLLNQSSNNTALAFDSTCSTFLQPGMTEVTAG